MLLKSLTTNRMNYAPLISRVLLGAVMFPHGAQKLFGWFGGFGFEGTMGYFTGTAGLPWIVGFLVILIESIGSLFLIAGLASRLMALSMTGIALGIIATSHHDYFFMNWFGSQPSEGYEFFLLMIGLGISVTISGGGAWSVDGILQRKYRPEHQPDYAHK